jgi:hypothetical protein
MDLIPNKTITIDFSRINNPIKTIHLDHNELSNRCGNKRGFCMSKIELRTVIDKLIRLE